MHKKSKFDKWFKTMRHGVTSWDYFIDWNKVKTNVLQYKNEIEKIDKIIHKRNIESEFKSLVLSYPNIIKILPMIVATRKKRLFITEGGNEIEYDFSKTGGNIEKFIIFAKKTGIIDLFSSVKGNLSDFMLGVEVGMDTNARKNRAGTAMEVLVEAYLQDAGLEKDKTYWKQVDFYKFKKIFGINLFKKTGILKANRKFDFVVKVNRKIYIIETNIYHADGSKQGAISSGYLPRCIALEKKKNIKYVWITDGDGWQGEREGLKGAFAYIKHLYNINDLENKIFKKIFKK